MEARELRIGNYIQGQTENDFVEVISLSKSDFINELCKPIPLTKEWLVKFDLFGDDSTEKRRWFRAVLTDGVCDSKGVCFYKTISGHTIEYVHQLQNLYFALTGEELEIK